MKYEWKREEKDLYLPKNKPNIVTIPKMKYFKIKGHGNPNNNPLFQEHISALYALSYTVRMMPKKGITPNGYFEYTVYPLEGIWDLTEKGRQEETLNKDEFLYTLMIRQPNFVNEDVFNMALELVKKKNNSPFINEITFEEDDSYLCVHMMHIGSYDDEITSFKMMDNYVSLNGYKRMCFTHKEIYLSDFRKVEASKLKTVLRYLVKKI